jgi:hypothetical protein
VHRDIKPANILLENGIERVKITDFGLARATDDVGMTQSGQIAGTPQYMSPEQAMGQQVDTRSDLFSLGSVLYTLCTGRPGFRADSTLAVMKRVCDDVPRPIGETNPEIPEWLIEIIDRLLMKKPEDRIQTAAEVAELLNQHLAHLQQPASVPRPGRLRSPVVKGSANRLATAVLVATALMMLMGVAYSVWTDHLWFGSPVNPARLVETIPAPAVDLEPRAGAPHIASPFEKKTVSEPVAIEDPLQMPTVFPFAKGKARAYQEGWAKRLNVPVVEHDVSADSAWSVSDGKHARRIEHVEAGTGRTRGICIRPVCRDVEFASAHRGTVAAILHECLRGDGCAVPAVRSRDQLCDDG